jgi:hypothetical protein
MINLLQFPTLNHRCEITHGVRMAECRTLLQSFFAEQRHIQTRKRKRKNEESVPQNQHGQDLA